MKCEAKVKLNGETFREKPKEGAPPLGNYLCKLLHCSAVPDLYLYPAL